MNFKYVEEIAPFKKILSTPLKKEGFIPEKDSELFISGIPEDATVKELWDFFEQIGDIYQLKLMTQGENALSLNRGFAFITYMNKDLAEIALKSLTAKKFKMFYRLFIQKSFDNCRLFLGALPMDKTKQQIWEALIREYSVNYILDIIVYSNYKNAAYNRGFVFLEFRTHQDAAYFRAKYQDKLILFGRKISVDWSFPQTDTFDDNYSSQNKTIFLRNLDIKESQEEFTERIVLNLTDRENVEKVFKKKNYAYVHLKTKEECDNLLIKLRKYFENTIVDVQLSRPINKFSARRIKEKALRNENSLIQPRKRNWSTSSVFSSGSNSSSVAMEPECTDWWQYIEKIQKENQAYKLAVQVLWQERSAKSAFNSYATSASVSRIESEKSDSYCDQFYNNSRVRNNDNNNRSKYLPINILVKIDEPPFDFEEMVKSIIGD